MTQIIFNNSPVHLINVEQCQAAADTQTKPTNLGSESVCRLLLSKSTITIFSQNLLKPSIFDDTDGISKHTFMPTLKHDNTQ